MARAPDPDLERRYEIVVKMAHLYRFERATYLVITVLGALLLMASVITLLLTKTVDMKVLAGLFGSTGTVTGFVGLTLKMWNDSLKKVFGA